MKKKLTTILAMLLCAIITITGVYTETAYAAEDTTIKLTFKKKSVTYSVKENGIERVNLKSLKKKWGKPSDTYEYYGIYGYTWSKGKTNFTYEDNTTTPERSLFVINIGDKNGSISGIKVGMKKSKVKKILKKISNKVESSDEYGTINASIVDERVSISCQIKNGKVTHIYCEAYAEDVSK